MIHPEEKNRIDGSVGTIIGDGNHQTITTGGNDNEFDIPADEKVDLLVCLGRWIYNVNGEKRFLGIVIGLLLAAFAAFVVGMWPMLHKDYTTFFQSTNMYLIIGSTCLMVIPIRLLRLYRSRICPSCKKKFALREYKPKKHIGKGIYRKSVYHKIKRFLMCDYCNHKLEEEYLEEELEDE